MILLNNNSKISETLISEDKHFFRNDKYCTVHVFAMVQTAEKGRVQ
jgi:hypothetical protein